jgi:hypothetical protein
MRARLRDESGIAIVVAIFVTILMLGIGLALLSFADQQIGQTGKDRVKENALSLAEGALNAQANLLSAAWPESSDLAFAPCTQSSTSVKCPDPTNLLNGFTAKDFGAGGSASSWSITIRDNALGAHYDDTATAAQPAWDANADDVVWLRAEATVRGERRTLVSLVRATPVGQTFPRGVITAGHIHTTNNGNKVIIDTGSGPGVQGRCSAGAGGPGRGNACLDYVATKGQVWPNTWVSDPAIPNAMASSEVDSLRNRAKAAGTWYNGCPSSLPSAQLVFIESGNCSYSGNTNFNSPGNPGMLVLYSGTLNLGGTTNFYGLIYAVNANNITGAVVTLGGNTEVTGAVVVDGGGGVYAGSSKLNLRYDQNAFNLVTTTQMINVIANSWRELNQH